MSVRTRLWAGLGLAAALAVDASLGRDAQAGRNAHLPDPGRRAAELRRPSRDDLRHDPCGGAVLQRADPRPAGQSGLDHRVRLRPLHRDAEADRRRQDLHLQDPQGREVPRRQQAHRRRTWRRAGSTSSSRPRAWSARARATTTWSTRSRRPTTTTVVFKLKYATDGLPAGARRSLRLDLQEGDPREGSALVREEHHGLRPVQVRRATRSASRSRASATRTTITRASRYLDGIVGIFRRQAVGARRCAARRPRRDRVPRPAAVGARPARQGAGRQDQRCRTATGTAATS